MLAIKDGGSSAAKRFGSRGIIIVLTSPLLLILSKCKHPPLQDGFFLGVGSYSERASLSSTCWNHTQLCQSTFDRVQTAHSRSNMYSTGRFIRSFTTVR